MSKKRENKITIRYNEVHTTADCVAMLQEFKEGKWKRLGKFNLKVQAPQDSVVRTFQNGDKFITLIQMYDGLLVCRDMNLCEHKHIIDKMNALSKFYYTHDYGAIYYNPYIKSIVIVGGDGGVEYCEGNKDELKKIRKQNIPHEEILPHLKISELTHSEISDETSPDYADEEVDNEKDEENDWDEDNGEDFADYDDYVNYIEIGNINDLSQLDDEDDDDEDDFDSL